VDGTVLPGHPFDPTAPEISRDKPLMVGWNEDEYTFFAWQQRDGSFTEIDFASLHEKLEPDYGADTSTIIESYRRAMPDASAPDIFVAVSSINMMGLGSVEIAEKKAMQQGAPVYLYNFGYKSEIKYQVPSMPWARLMPWTSHSNSTMKCLQKKGKRPAWVSAGAGRNGSRLRTTLRRCGPPSPERANRLLRARPHGLPTRLLIGRPCASTLPATSCTTDLARNSRCGDR
jgi:hypothetical protein